MALKECILNAIADDAKRTAINVGVKVVAKDRGPGRDNIGRVVKLMKKGRKKYAQVEFKSVTGIDGLIDIELNNLRTLTPAHINIPQAEEMIKLYDEYFEAATKASASKGEDQISLEVIDVIKRDLTQQKRIKLGNILKKIELEDMLDDVLASGGNPYNAFKGLATPWGEGSIIGKNLEQQESIIFNRAVAPLNDFIMRLGKTPGLGTRFGNDKTRKVFGGQREKLALMDDLVRELHIPKSTANKEAQEFARLISDSFEHMRLLHNKYGGDIQYNAKYALPQAHMASKIVKQGRTAWKKALMGDETNGWKGLLSRESMKGNYDGLPLDNDSLNKILDDTFDVIVSDGASKADAWGGAVGGGKRSIAKRHQEHRVLIFKDGDSHLQYQREFGENDLFDVIMNHHRSMAKDISLMQVLGPNPDSMVDFLSEKIRAISFKDTTERTNLLGRKVNNTDLAKNSTHRFKLMLKHYKGLEEPANRKTALLFKNFRGMIMATRLAFTPLIAGPTDMATTRHMAKMNGIGEMKAVRGYIDALANIKDRKERIALAARYGLINQSMVDGTSTAMARFLHEDNATPWVQFIVDSSLRINGLTHVTQRGRQHAGMMLMQHHGANLHLPYAKLNQGTQKGLSRYGITPNKWELMRKAEPEIDMFGKVEVKALTPGRIAKIKGISAAEASDLSDDYYRLVLGEVEVAVPTVSLRERSILRGSDPGGTIIGELGQSFAMFKSWPMAYWNKHVSREWAEAATGMDKAKALTETALWMMTAGVVGVQLYEIAHGRKPMDWNNPHLWGKGLSRGGGLGPAYDVLLGLGDYRGGFPVYVAGPMFTAAQQIGYALAGPISGLADGGITPSQSTRLIKEASSWIPYQGNWMFSLLMKRLLWERVLMHNDPKYVRKLRNRVRAHERQGQEYFWKPGR
jgi:hypothetical protein